MKRNFPIRLIASVAALINVVSIAHAAELPSAMTGERVLRSTGASMGLALRSLTYADGALTGRADVWMVVPKASTDCSRADVAVTGQYSLSADGRLEKMVVTYPSTRGPMCDDLKMTFKYDPATDSFVADGPSFRWTLRATKP
jgi:hypothetical protein